MSPLREFVGSMFFINIRTLEVESKEEDVAVVIPFGCRLEIRGWRNAISGRDFGTLSDATDRVLMFAAASAVVRMG